MCPDYRLDPPERKEEVALNCEACSAAIYTGDTYYNVDGDVWCEECMEDYIKAVKRTA